MEGESTAKREEKVSLDQPSLVLETLPILGPKYGYRYSLLPNPKTYIRLLKVTTEKEGIKGSLEAFPVSEAPPFCALSYAWGTDLPTSSLMCDSARLPITEHLLCGMKRIRHCNPTVWIWIDAICINQNDNEEKAHQIPLMEKIYSLAERVLVWLGEATEDTEHALGQLEHIRDCIRKSDGHIYRGGTAFLEASLPAAEDPFWKTLADFYCRSWFKRLWILQEVILAKDVSFICGGQTSDFELLWSFSLDMYNAGIAEHLKSTVFATRMIQGYSTLINVGGLRKEFSTDPPLNSLSLLEKGRSHSVKEPVDRVYGLLGLMEETVKRHIAVDYSVEARSQYWRLYVTVAKVLIKLDQLALLTIAESEERPSQLPSWVPNWNSRPSTTALAGHFHAGYNSKSKNLLEDVLIPNSDSLQLPGFRVGTILGISALQHKNYKDSKELMGPKGLAARELTMMDEAYTIYQFACREPENILLQRFARTLIADTGSPAGSTRSTDDHKYLQDAREDYIWYRAYLSDFKNIRRGAKSAINQEKMRENARAYAMNLPTQWYNRSFFVTDSGRIGLCSQSCQPGDIICIFLSAKHTYVLRQVPDKLSFTFVSCAYTDEVMYSEALDGRDPASDEIFIID